jgi:hypothetical protein
MKKSILSILALIAILGFGAFWLLGRSRSEPKIKTVQHAQNASGAAIAPPTRAPRPTSSPSQTLDLLRAPSSQSALTRKELFNLASAAAHKFLTEDLSGTAAEQEQQARARLEEGLNFLRGVIADVPKGSGGRNLPDSMARSFESGSFEQVFSVREGGLFESEEQAYFGAELYFISGWAIAMDGQHLTDYISDRAQRSPVTLVDEVTYWGMSGGIADISPFLARNRPTTESLMPFATASNPIYRLLVLDALGVSLPSGVSENPPEENEQSIAIAKAKLPALRLYAEEDDPIILGRLIELISMRPLNEAVDLLKAIRDRQATKGNKALSDKAESAISSVTARIETGLVKS